MFWRKTKAYYQEKLAGKVAKLAALQVILNGLGSINGYQEDKVLSLSEDIAKLKVRIDNLKEDNQ